MSAIDAFGAADRRHARRARRNAAAAAARRAAAAAATRAPRSGRGSRGPGTRRTAWRRPAATCRWRRHARSGRVAPMMAQPRSGSRPASVPVSVRLADVAGASEGSPDCAATPNRCAFTMAAMSTLAPGASHDRRARQPSLVGGAEHAPQQGGELGGDDEDQDEADDRRAPRPRARRPRRRSGGARARRYGRLAASLCLARGPGKPRHDTGSRRAATRRKTGGKQKEWQALVRHFSNWACDGVAIWRMHGPVTCATGGPPL